MRTERKAVFAEAKTIEKLQKLAAKNHRTAPAQLAYILENWKD